MGCVCVWVGLFYYKKYTILKNHEKTTCSLSALLRIFGIPVMCVGCMGCMWVVFFGLCVGCVWVAGPVKLGQLGPLCILETSPRPVLQSCASARCSASHGHLEARPQERKKEEERTETARTMANVPNVRRALKSAWIE